MVDTLGLLLVVGVQAANIQDGTGAKRVLARMQGRFPRLRKIWADGAYRGGLIAWTQALLGCILEIVTRSDDQKGFVASCCLSAGSSSAPSAGSGAIAA